MLAGPKEIYPRLSSSLSMRPDIHVHWHTWIVRNWVWRLGSQRHWPKLKSIGLWVAKITWSLDFLDLSYQNNQIFLDHTGVPCLFSYVSCDIMLSSIALYFHKYYVQKQFEEKGFISSYIMKWGGEELKAGTEAATMEEWWLLACSLGSHSGTFLLFLFIYL